MKEAQVYVKNLDSEILGEAYPLIIQKIRLTDRNIETLDDLKELIKELQGLKTAWEKTIDLQEWIYYYRQVHEIAQQALKIDAVDPFLHTIAAIAISSPDIDAIYKCSPSVDLSEIDNADLTGSMSDDDMKERVAIGALDYDVCFYLRSLLSIKEK